MRLILEVALAIGLFRLAAWDGILIATTSISAGVLFEAVYATVRVRPVLLNELPPAAPPSCSSTPSLTLNRFMRFYLPLALTTLLQISLQPLVSASLSRMPDSLGSLALWPVLYGVLIMANSAAIAYVEAVIVLLDRPGSLKALRRFTWQLGLSLSAIPLVLAVTPLGRFLFFRITGLPLELIEQAQNALWLMIPLPALTTLSSWFQGTLINSQRTRAITEAVLLSSTTIAVLLALGSLWGGQPCLTLTAGSQAFLCGVPGVYIAMVAFTVGLTMHNLWLWRRTQRIYLSIRLGHAGA